VQDPDQYNPPLRLRDHVWRTAGALAITGIAWGNAVGAEWRSLRWLFWVDLLLGLASFALCFYRRRWPFPIALALSAFGGLSTGAAGPATLVAVSLATRRVTWQIVTVGVASVASSLVFWLVNPPAVAETWWASLGLSVVFTVVTMLWGMYVGSRRELLWTLRDRVERAEAERELRFSQGRSNERARIAREMHDVLAHRITLITMHAGALAYRSDLSPEQIRTTAELIQTKSHEALTDLRQVLGVLRADRADTDQPEERPQPTFGDLRALIDEAEESGMRVHFDDQVAAREQIPDPIGRTAYRIVQEGLTNARKHAPGATVSVAVTGSPDAGLEIRVRNLVRGLTPACRPGHPESGLGLVGLVERAKLAGGQLDSRLVGGAFELRGWLPWTS
jgi:signal transduction histidine kinase